MVSSASVYEMIDDLHNPSTMPVETLSRWCLLEMLTMLVMLTVMAMARTARA